MPSCRSSAHAYSHMLLNFTDTSLDGFFWEWARASAADLAVRLRLGTSLAYQVSHVALGDGLVLVPRLGVHQPTDKPMTYCCLCYASSLHPAWNRFSPDPFTTRMQMLRLLSAVAARVTSVPEHKLCDILKMRVSTDPCDRDTSFELADLHDQFVGANLQPLGTFLCTAPHAVLIFRALLGRGVICRSSFRHLQPNGRRVARGAVAGVL